MILAIPAALQQENPVPTRVELCKTEDVAVGSARKVEAGGLAVAVYNIDGEFFVTDDACTHGPGSLSEGYIDGDVIECNFHNGQFNIKTGEVVSPPCMIPVKTYPALVQDGKIFIEI
jgi:nitrite reductase/ring-hydroxylating ferredoxin subunit